MKLNLILAAVAAGLLGAMPVWGQTTLPTPVRAGGAASRPAAATQPALTLEHYGDDALARAEAYVLKSDRYLHHSKLRRGMKGYGLTVMAGTKIVRFDAEIVSVMTKWGPHQDVILAQLSGLNLDKSGIIAGMSGSPVFVKDPADGKEKMIGAVAYGWMAQKEPLCGIQPITQMLAVGDVLDRAPAPQDLPVASGQEPASHDSAADPNFLAAVLSPQKMDYAQWLVGSFAAADAVRNGSPRLVPLKTPLMVSGLNSRSFSVAAEQLGEMGITLVQSGGAGAADPSELAGVKLEPGSGIAVPLASGDADLCAVGTVTDVLGNRVLAFGHAFFAEGKTAMPMGPAYIHTVVSGVIESFKLGSLLSVTGTLNCDENTGIAGTVGPKVTTIPMTVAIDWKSRHQRQTFHYNLIRHRRLTPLLMSYLLSDACFGWRDCPIDHTIRYNVEIDFGKLGKYRAKNISSNDMFSSVMSDVLRPVAAVLYNPWSVPPDVQSVKIDISIDDQSRMAQVLEFNLDGKVYRPGDTVSGEVTIQPYRQPRQTLAVKFELPADLPEGQYTLSVCDSQAALQMLRSEMPQRFDPRNLSDLFRQVQEMVQLPDNQLYLRLPLGKGGLAIRHKELPDLPTSKVQILQQSQQRETNLFTSTLVRSVGGQYVFSGQASARFEVREEPRQLLTHPLPSKEE